MSQQENMNSYELETTITEEGFWNAINVLVHKPHVANQKLWGSKIISTSKRFVNNNITLDLFKSRFDNIDEIKNSLKSEDFLNGQQLDNQGHEENCAEVLLVELLPKNYSAVHAYNLICLIKAEHMAIFVDVTPELMGQHLCPNFSYSILLQKDKLILNACCDANSTSFQWLVKTVIPKLVKWSTTDVCNKNDSLSLVAVDKYYTKYNELKLKYGKDMVKIWPECTDPSKYVYEDIAIATYLLLLWEDDRKIKNLDRSQSFVDLGCGNGLLVFILASEGHPGLGVDVRKRAIWDMYPNFVKLEERTIMPSDFNLFPDTDWIIGNHSDELTPWVPVLTLRSSYLCNFFLLPCCAFNFDGSKYRRQNSSKSQFSEYLEYIENLSIQCGFNVKNDRLKIPSTKRICIVGRQRLYPQTEHDLYCQKIQSLITTSSLVNNTDCWIPNFKPRESVEKVRNCTRIDKSIIEYFIELVAHHLLKDGLSNPEWSDGKVTDIRDLVRLIPADMLKNLKAECGGIQTLLKNNRHIFKVQKGKVNFRYPKTINEVNDNVNNNKSSKSLSLNIKKKPCWFYKNHPQGCPLTNESCSFLHFSN